MRKKTVNFQLPFCKTNEEKIKFIVNKLEFTKNKVTFIYHRKTRKLKFRIKYKITQGKYSLQQNLFLQ